MNVLIDTQSLIWFCEDNPFLPVSVKQYMEESSGLVLVSYFSASNRCFANSIAVLKRCSSKCLSGSSVR